MKNNYKAICLSSGGIKGYYMLGCLNYLHERNELDNIKYYIGTSIGSVICLLLIINYSPIDILNYLCINDINKDINFNNILTNLCNHHGIVDIYMLEKYLENMVVEKIGYIPTFNDLLLKYNKFFICNSFCISKNTNEKKIYFHPEYSPDLQVTKAVCMSCSIPLIFTKYIFKDNIYIDGAIFDNFSIKKLIEIIDDKIHIKKGNILGIYFNYDNEIQNIDLDKITVNKIQNENEFNIDNIFYNLITKGKYIFTKNAQFLWDNISNIFNYIKTLFYHTIFDYQKYDNYKEDDRIHMICLQTNNEQINFNIKSKEKINMFLKGFNQTKEYYNNVQKQKNNKTIKID